MRWIPLKARRLGLSIGFIPCRLQRSLMAGTHFESCPPDFYLRNCFPGRRKAPLELDVSAPEWPILSSVDGVGQRSFWSRKRDLDGAKDRLRVQQPLRPLLPSSPDPIHRPLWRHHDLLLRTATLMSSRENHVRSPSLSFLREFTFPPLREGWRPLHLMWLGGMSGLADHGNTARFLKALARSHVQPTPDRLRNCLDLFNTSMFGWNLVYSSGQKLKVADCYSSSVGKALRLEFTKTWEVELDSAPLQILWLAEGKALAKCESSLVVACCSTGTAQPILDGEMVDVAVNPHLSGEVAALDVGGALHWGVLDGGWSLIDGGFDSEPRTMVWTGHPRCLCLGQSRSVSMIDLRSNSRKSVSVGDGEEEVRVLGAGQDALFPIVTTRRFFLFDARRLRSPVFSLFHDIPGGPDFLSQIPNYWLLGARLLNEVVVASANTNEETAGGRWLVNGKEPVFRLWSPMRALSMLDHHFPAPFPPVVRDRVSVPLRGLCAQFASDDDQAIVFQISDAGDLFYQTVASTEETAPSQPVAPEFLESWQEYSTSVSSFPDNDRPFFYPTSFHEPQRCSHDVRDVFFDGQEHLHQSACPNLFPELYTPTLSSEAFSSTFEINNCSLAEKFVRQKFFSASS